MFVAERKMLRPQRRLGCVVAQIDRRQRYRLKSHPQHDEDGKHQADDDTLAAGVDPSLREPHQAPAGARAPRLQILGGLGTNNSHYKWMPLKSRPHKHAKMRPLAAHCIY